MFKRLSFGISYTQDIFQATMSEMLDDIEVVVDDLLILGETDDKRLRKDLERAQQCNLKLNKEKARLD